MFTRIVFAQLADGGGRRWTLVSIAGTLQEFESPILRHADLLKDQSSVRTGWRLKLRWSQLLISVSSVGWVPLGFAALLRLATGIVDGPERRSARRRSIRRQLHLAAPHVHGM
jgi:hypothetical protein